MFKMFQPKTLTNVLSSVTAVVSDLEEIAKNASYEATDKEKEATELLDCANESRETAAHANIVADRISNMMYVSSEDIASVVASNKADSRFESRVESEG